MTKRVGHFLSLFIVTVLVFISSVPPVTAAGNTILFSDSFTGTSIDTDKWTVYDNGGNHVIQNDKLTTSGNNTFDGNGLVSKSVFDRSLNDLTIETDLTYSRCDIYSGGIFYGPRVTSGIANGTILLHMTGGSSTYMLSAFNQTVSVTGIACQNNVPAHVKLVIKSGGGVDLYMNGNATPNASLTVQQAPNTFTNYPVILQEYNSASSYDNLVVSGEAQVPGSPTIISTTPGDRLMYITWNAPTTDGGSPITDYFIEYKISSDSSWSAFDDGISLNTTTTITGLTNDISYDFRVSAINIAGTSNPGNTISATPTTAAQAPSSPTNILPVPDDSGIQLSWSAPFDGGSPITDYTIEYKTSYGSTAWTAFVDGISANTSATVTPLINGTVYELRVSAVNGIGVSDPSTSISSVPVPASTTYLQILSGGQSLSMGYEAVPTISNQQPYNNVSLSPDPRGTDAPLTPLVEAGVETPSSGIANSLHAYDIQNRPIAIGLHGSNGAGYNNLKKGTYNYNKGISQAITTKSLIEAAGNTYRPVAVTIVHGENDYMDGHWSQYEGNLREWQNDYQTDLNSIMGTSSTIPMFINQMSTGWTGEIASAQLDAHTNNPGKIILVGPKYQYPYDLSRLHLTNIGYKNMGEMFAKVIDKVALKGETWNPLMPTEIIGNGNIVTISYHIPVGNLVIDSTAMAQRPNYGFEFTQTGGTPTTINSVELINNSAQVKITLSRTPDGTDPRIRYAWTCPYTNGARPAGYGLCGDPSNPNYLGGNIRDEDTSISPSLDSTGIPLYNWSISFDKPIIPRADNVLFSTNFSGTDIDTNRWIIADTSGNNTNVVQNGSLAITGNNTFNGNGVITKTSFDRSRYDLTAEVDMTFTDCNSSPTGGLFYGPWVTNTLTTGLVIFNRAGGSYNLWSFGQNVNVPGPACVNNVPIHIKMVLKSAGGVDVYLNGSTTPNGSLTQEQSPNTYTNHPFSLQEFNTTTIYDNFSISGTIDAPGAPTGLTATPGDSQILLSWTAPTSQDSQFITDYIIEYKRQSDSNWTTFDDGISPITSATITGLTNGITYDMRVTSSSPGGVSEPSNIISGSPSTEARQPQAPVNLTAAGEDTGVFLSWLAPADGGSPITDYNIEYKTSYGSVWRTFDDGLSALTSATVTGLTNGTSYSFRVSASNIIGTSDFSNTASGLPSPTFQTYLQILSGGQSLSEGFDATDVISVSQPYNNVTLSPNLQGTDPVIIPLRENYLESPSSGLANTLHAYDTQNRPIAVGLHGQGGSDYQALKKGTDMYNKGILQATTMKNLVEANGNTYKPVGVTIIHGEDDYKDENFLLYEGFLREWQNDYQSDINAIMGTSSVLPMFINQMNTGWTGEIASAQLNAHINNPGKIIMAGPKYQYPSSWSHIHLSSIGYKNMGEMLAKVIDKVAIKGETWNPLMPTSVSGRDSVITISYHIPFGNLAIDTTTVAQRENYGFEFFQTGGSAITINSVELINNNTQVKIILSRAPDGTNPKIRYAWTCPRTGESHPAGYGYCGDPSDPDYVGGNIRDTDNSISPALDSTGLPLYDWSVAFDRPIIPEVTVTYAQPMQAGYGSYPYANAVWVKYTGDQPTISKIQIKHPVTGSVMDETNHFTFAAQPLSNGQFVVTATPSNTCSLAIAAKAIKQKKLMLRFVYPNGNVSQIIPMRTFYNYFNTREYRIECGQ